MSGYLLFINTLNDIIDFIQLLTVSDATVAVDAASAPTPRHLADAVVTTVENELELLSVLAISFLKEFIDLSKIKHFDAEDITSWQEILSSIFYVHRWRLQLHILNQ